MYELQEEEGTDDDSSSSNTSDDVVVHVAAKAEIASHILRNYYCSDRYDFDNEIIVFFWKEIKCENNDGLNWIFFLDLVLYWKLFKT